MRPVKKWLVLVLVCMFLQQVILAQTPKITALKTELQHATEDSAKLRLYILLCDASDRKDNLPYAQSALALADKLLAKSNSAEERKQWLDQKAGALSYIAVYYSEGNTADLNQEIKYAERTLKIRQELGDKSQTAAALWHLATIYERQGNIPKALEYCHNASRLADALTKEVPPNDARALSDAFQTHYLVSRALADIYVRVNDTATAIIYYKQSIAIAENAIRISQKNKRSKEYHEAKSMLSGTYWSLANLLHYNEPARASVYCDKILEITRELKDTGGIADAYNLRGLIFHYQGKYDLALQNFEHSLQLCRSGFEHDLIGEVWGNIGRTREKMGQYQEALDCYFHAIALDRNYEYTDIGRIYFTQKAYPKAERYWKLALEYAQKSGIPGNIDQAAKLLSDVYRAEKKFDLALQMYELHVLMNDSTKNEGMRKTAMEKQFRFEYEKKEALAKAELQQEQTRRYVLYGGLALLTVFGGFMFNRFRVTSKQKKVIEKQKDIVEKEKHRSDELLLNILPSEVAEELKEYGSAKAKSFGQVTVLFTDFKNFTQASEKLSAEELVREIHYCYSEFDKIITKYGIEKIKTIGDSYMCAGGLPATNDTHPWDVVNAGLELQAFVEAHKAERIQQNQPYFELRLGIHTGPVVAGIVGIKKFAYDIWGDTVNTASRMESSGEVGKVNISGTTYEIIKDRFHCTYRGKVKAKNKGEIDMYFVEGIRSNNT